MKKKIIALGLCVALLAVAIVGGTLAYFTDIEAKQNNFVVGEVDIVLNEVFDPADPLVPGDPTVAENLVQKEVTITNNGESPAYVRLLIAYEDTKDVGQMAYMGLNDPYGYKTNGRFPNTPTEDNYVIPSNRGKVSPTSDWLQIKDADGTVYTVAYVTLSDPLAKGETSDRILNSLAIKAQADNAWAEIVGERYDVLVLAQGAQVIDGKDATYSIDTAFGFTMDETADEQVAALFTKAGLGTFTGTSYDATDAWAPAATHWDAFQKDATPIEVAPNDDAH